MITINTQGLDKKFEALNAVRRMLNTSDGRGIIKSLAALALDSIYKRVKSGYGVSDDKADAPTKQSFASMKSFSPKYLRFRKLHPPTGEFASPGKQNLTYTGQMLRAMNAKVFDSGFSLYIDNTSRRGSDLTNYQVAAYASKKRPFFALTDKETDVLQREYNKLIRQLINKIIG